jgi:hypothetical protein
MLCCVVALVVWFCVDCVVAVLFCAVAVLCCVV